MLVAVAGGPLGTGRMADVGAPVPEVLVFASGLMGVGGLVGALVGNWRQRRHGAGHDDGQQHDGQHDDGQHDDGEEPTVEVLR
jgi:hypothetical protein